MAQADAETVTSGGIRAGIVGRDESAKQGFILDIDRGVELAGAFSDTARTTSICFAGFSLANCTFSESRRAFGVFPSSSEGSVARMLASLKCLLPDTVTPAIGVS